MTVKGVEHIPRGALRAFRETPAAGVGAHRPKGSGDLVSRDLLDARVGELLDEDPALTLARLQGVLGIAYSTAARVLPRLRGERIARLSAGEKGLSLQEAAERLGYPAAVRRAALDRAATELRALQMQSYVQEVADALAAEGLTLRQDVTLVRVASDVIAAAVPLSSSAPVPAVVWDERWGWRTAASRRHPLGRETGAPAEGEGIRYLSGQLQPPAADV